MGSGKPRWKIFSRSTDRLEKNKPPKEFICPISGNLMADPTITSSGQTFERNCILACKELGFVPILPDGLRPDFTTLIPNISIKTTILHWCDKSHVDRPKPLELNLAKDIVRSLMEESQDVPVNRVQIGNSEKDLIEGIAENPVVNLVHAASELKPRLNYLSSNSDESGSMVTPLPLATKPSCYYSSSSSSSSEIVSDENLTQIMNSNSSQEEREIISKMNSQLVSDQEEAVLLLRELTKKYPQIRVSLCNSRLLRAICPLLNSKYPSLQINSMASIVNLSLEKTNKITIVRSGLVPPIIDVLKGGVLEAQEHAAGAIFSLAINDDNKTAIGVLGALPPLLHCLCKGSDRTRQDSALALYHLSLTQTNRTKLARLGAVPPLLAMMKGGNLATRSLLIICNLALCEEGRTSLLDANAVEELTQILQETSSMTMKEHCVAALCALSSNNLRFNGLAKEAGVVEALREVAETGEERTREKAKRLMMVMKGKGSSGNMDVLGDDPSEEEGRVSDYPVSPIHYHRRVRNISGPMSSDF